MTTRDTSSSSSLSVETPPLAALVTLVRVVVALPFFIVGVICIVVAGLIADSDAGALIG